MVICYTPTTNNGYIIKLSMRSRKRLFRASVALMLSASAYAESNDVLEEIADDQSITETSIVGTWALEVSGPRGVQHPILKVSEDKSMYHGVFTGQRGQVLMEAIKVEENNFSFQMNVKTPRGKLKLK